MKHNIIKGTVTIDGQIYKAFENSLDKSWKVVCGERHGDPTVFRAPKEVNTANKAIKAYLESIKTKGEYFADYDEESGLYCVFHTDKKTGFAYSSWGSMEDASKDAECRNKK
jgi:hypothetical protein